MSTRSLTLRPPCLLCLLCRYKSTSPLREYPPRQKTTGTGAPAAASAASSDGIGCAAAPSACCTCRLHRCGYRHAAAAPAAAGDGGACRIRPHPRRGGACRKRPGDSAAHGCLRCLRANAPPSVGGLPPDVPLSFHHLTPKPCARFVPPLLSLSTCSALPSRPPPLPPLPASPVDACANPAPCLLVPPSHPDSLLCSRVAIVPEHAARVRHCSVRHCGATCRGRAPAGTASAGSGTTVLL